MGDKLEARAARPGDPMFEATIRMCDAMRAATKDIVGEFADPRDGVTVVMSAAAMFSGMQAGTLLALGAFREQDKSRIVAAATVNFRQGMKLGRDRGLRVGAEMSGGTA